MGVCLVLPISRNTIPVARAFQSRGVSLKFSARSRSGLSADDGMVIFAMPAALVRTSDWGCSCLLWNPASARRSTDEASHVERLAHCRLAVRHGIAEGFVLDQYDRAPAQPELLTLLVVRAGDEYWARWGTVARARCFDGGLEVPGTGARYCVAHARSAAGA